MNITLASVIRKYIEQVNKKMFRHEKSYFKRRWCNDDSVFRKPNKSCSAGKVHIVRSDAEIAIL